MLVYDVRHKREWFGRYERKAGWSGLVGTSENRAVGARSAQSGSGVACADYFYVVFLFEFHAKRFLTLM
jgi:hypothetical protein